MNQTLTFLLSLMAFTALSAQTTADFENLGVAPGTFVNNAAGGSFESGNVSLPNTYSADFDFWSGWALSAVDDSDTPGFGNQYAAAAGRGVDGSDVYAVGYALPSATIYLRGAAAGAPVDGMYVTNSTYAYFSMLEGDAFAKRFGGESGNDPDFFLLTVRGLRDGMETTDSVAFYLADYRFSDNSQDYIVNTWTYIDLTPLGPVDAIQCYLSSSDNGQFGMNTPGYVCVDNIITSDMTVSVQQPATATEVRAFPNPTSDFLQFGWSSSAVIATATVRLTDTNGRLVLTQTLASAGTAVDIRHLPVGMYYYTLLDGNQVLGSGKVVKD